MIFYTLKVVISVAVILVVSELAKKEGLISGIVASLPLTTLLAILWLYFETKDISKIAALSTSVFFMVIPSLVLLAALPFLLRLHISFFPALGISIFCTIAAYLVMIYLLSKFGIQL